MLRVTGRQSFLEAGRTRISFLEAMALDLCLVRRMHSEREKEGRGDAKRHGVGRLGATQYHTELPQHSGLFEISPQEQIGFPFR